MKILKATTAYKRINSESPDYLANMLKLNSSKIVREKESVASFKHNMNSLLFKFHAQQKLLFKEGYENIDHFII